MAKRKTKSCKTVVVCGVKRKICRDKLGRITSSKPIGKGKRKTKRKASAKKRKGTCKYGKLKNPVGNRICKKPKKKAKRAKKRTTKRKSAARRKCKYGKLKSPVGKRVCKKPTKKARKTKKATKKGRKCKYGYTFKTEIQKSGPAKRVRRCRAAPKRKKAA